MSIWGRFYACCSDSEGSSLAVTHVPVFGLSQQRGTRAAITQQSIRLEFIRRILFSAQLPQVTILKQTVEVFLNVLAIHAAWHCHKKP